jgi:hypothetical protein
MPVEGTPQVAQPAASWKNASRPSWAETVTRYGTVWYAQLAVWETLRPPKWTGCVGGGRLGCAVIWPTASDWVWDGTANPYRSYPNNSQKRTPPTSAGLQAISSEDTEYP